MLPLQSVAILEDNLQSRRVWAGKLVVGLQQLSSYLSATLKDPEIKWIAIKVILRLKTIYALNNIAPPPY